MYLILYFNVRRVEFHLKYRLSGSRHPHSHSTPLPYYRILGELYKILLAVSHYLSVLSAMNIYDLFVSVLLLISWRLQLSRAEFFAIFREESTV